MSSIIKERLRIFKSKLFIFGIVIRFLFLFTSGGKVFSTYFIPFLDYFAQNPNLNPWSHFPPEYFPYGAFPLLVTGILKVMAFNFWGEATLGFNSFNYFLIKFPLLFFDALIFWILSRLSLITEKRLLWFYWLNPVVIYISFIYCQLDVISMSLLLSSLFLIGKGKFKPAGLVGGLSIVSKFHIAVVLPFVAAYIWNNNFKKKAYKEIFSYFSILALTSILGFVPVILAKHFSYSTLTSPEAMRLLAARINFGLNIEFIIGLAFVILILGRLVFSTKITYNGLIYGSGFLLGCLVITTNAQPSWYLWLLPFLALFYANYSMAPKSLFIITLIFYFIHFLLMSEFDFNYQSMSFTLMQLGFLVQLFTLYWMSLRRECQLRFRLKPMMIGISGDSGAGKNHLSLCFQSILDPKNCLVVEGDNYHKWERGDKNWNIHTHLNPNANNLIKMQEHAQQISSGKSIYHHHYDHSTGKFVQQALTNPTKTIIFQGLHTLYLKSLRDILDIKIFLDPSEEVRTFWKIQRDVFERGHSKEKVLDSLNKRKADSELHIRSQREKSDWIIEVRTENNSFNPLLLEKSTELSLFVTYEINNDEPIAELVEAIKQEGSSVELEFLPTNLDRIRVTIKGYLEANKITNIAKSVFPQIRHLTRANNPPVFQGGLEGLHQLMLLSILSKRIEETK